MQIKSSLNLDNGKVARSGLLDGLDSVFADPGVNTLREGGGVGVRGLELERTLSIEGKDLGGRNGVSGTEDNELCVLVGVTSLLFPRNLDGVSGDVVDGKLPDSEDGREGSTSEGGTSCNSFVLVKGEAEGLPAEELLDSLFDGRDTGRATDKLDRVNLVNSKTGLFKGLGKRNRDSGEEMVGELLEGFSG